MKRTIWMLSVALFVWGSSFAQTESEGKIVVEITKEINGERKTFKGEYDSVEEMKADPNYQEFAGEGEDFNIWLSPNIDEDVFLQLDQLNDWNQSFFRFFDEEKDGGHGFFFKRFDDDSLNGFFNFHMDAADRDAFRKRMESMRKEMEMMMRPFRDEDERREVRTLGKRIKIMDVDNEFGKKGKVDENTRLKLNDLEFLPNPSPHGRFKLRFSVPEEGELSIKISNLEGGDVFSRYFERFGGLYSETIDLSSQSEGIYLLEISQGKKRLTKKVVIN